MGKLEFLKSVPAFRDFSDKALERITGSMERKDAHAGESIFSEGDPSDYLYVVESGSVLVSKRLAEGVEKPLSVSGDRTIIGEMSLFTDRARTADLRAKTNVSYWRIPSKLLKQMAQEDAGGMLRLVENLLLIALERLEYTSRELATVFEISKTLARNLSMEDFSLEIIRQLIYSVPDVDAGVLYVWDEFTDEFESPGKPSLEKKHPLVRHAIEKNETFFAGEKDAADLLKGIIEVKCALVAPVADRKPQGILVLGDTKTCVQYPQSAMDLLNSVALQISGAIENIRSRQDMLARQRFERTRSGSVNW